MRRRALLAAVGTTATGLVGCLSQSDDGTTPGPTATTADTATPTPLSVTFDALQPGLVTPTTPDSIGVRGDAGQYLSLSVTAESGSIPPTGDFAFTFDGKRHDPLSFEAFYGQPWRLRSDESDAELLFFGLPDSGTASDVTLTWPGGEWTPGPAIRERLAAPLPRLDVSVSIPETVPRDEPATVTVTVANDGSLDGRFVAGLNRVGPMVAYTPVERFSFRVPAGETGTEQYSERPWRWMSDDRVDDDESDCTYHFDWAGGRTSGHVRAVASTISP